MCLDQCLCCVWSGVFKVSVCVVCGQVCLDQCLCCVWSGVFRSVFVLCVVRCV